MSRRLAAAAVALSPSYSQPPPYVYHRRLEIPPKLPRVIIEMAPQIPLQTQVNLKLAERGQRERLLNNLIEQLHISGWYEEARRAAAQAVYARQNTAPSDRQSAQTAAGEPVSDFHLVLGQVQEDMWRKIPVEVQRDMYQRISAALDQVLKK
ncbi:hypothetical protein DRE_00726 [Drechslerella stenobrocha 248]|uniref:Uncharacterized protein n=1 Tax=Drechslerella stenobrocha 248 TaxID=1043628 RepID=W7HYQ9_9PEZI|nr:hypothetical protein DRE_00726 [Drechslerella stenobrocha 248]